MEVKLEDGRKFKLRNITLDERDELMDGVEYNYDKNGDIKSLKLMNTTMTKWFRTCLKDNSDDTLFKLDIEERTEIFSKLQSLFMQGEEKASK
tara:strand:+ start:162 stop:440 length:279 start_codon:yes stop_codon:yes gene_type:complete